MIVQKIIKNIAESNRNNRNKKQWLEIYGLPFNKENPE